jgi:hypothetical protein
MRSTLAPALALVLGACVGTDDTGNPDDFDFPGGNFQFSNVAVADDCLDGAMAALFLPEGPGSRQDWAVTTELPPWGALPAAYVMDMQAPFQDMDIEVFAGSAEGTLVIDGALQEGVHFDEATYPDCTVNMDIAADVVIDGDDSVHGVAFFQVSGYAGDSCPPFATDPCQITLNFVGARVQ